MMAKQQRVRIGVIGVELFERKIQALAESLGDAELDDILYAGGEVVLADAQARIDSRSGNLRDSGYVVTQSKTSYQAGKRRNKTRKAIKRTALVAFAARYAHMVEFGTQAHIIPIKRSKALKTTENDYARSAEHPGAKAKPFLRPAWDATQDQVVRVVSDELRRRVRG